MKIAIFGTRGIPNHYGGFEQYAELLAVYLYNQGWDVTVYSSSHHPYQNNRYKGVDIRHIYDPEDKWGTVGQFAYDYKCIKDICRSGFDIIYQLGYTSSAIFNFLLPEHTLLVTNMDGMEWKRSKYNQYVRRFLKYSETIVAKRSDYLVADSPAIKDYLDKKYNKASFYSSYTAAIPRNFDSSVLSEYDTKPYGYNILVARMEPENNVEMIIKGHLQASCNMPLIIVGNTEKKYGMYLRGKYSSGKIRFIGAVYDKSKLDSLRHFSQWYFHGHSVGGTNPSLLEAMACGCNIAAHNNEFNRAVLRDDAFCFNEPKQVADIIVSNIRNEAAINNNLEKIARNYSEQSVFPTLINKLYEWHSEKLQRF